MSEYNYFMAVVFPQSHLKIIDYNRVVKDSERDGSRNFPAGIGTGFPGGMFM